MKHWTRQESKERFPKAITPLGWSLLHVPLEASLLRMSETLGVKKYARSEMVIWENFIVYTRKDFFSDLSHLRFNYLRLLKFFFQGLVTFFHTLFTFYKKGSFKDRFANELFDKIFGHEVEALVKSWPLQLDYLKQIMGRDYQLSAIKELDHETFVKIRTQMQEDSKVFFAEDFTVYFFKKLIFELLVSQFISAGLSKNDARDLMVSLSNGLQGNFSIQMVLDFNNENLSVLELKKRYGHLTDNWDLYHPTFGEEESLWQNRHFKSLPAKHFNSSAFELKINELLSWNPKRKQLVHWFQQLVLMDEDLRAFSSLQYPEARTLMSLVEETAAWKELIVKKDSVYFLHLNELEFGLLKSDFHLYFDLILERRKAYLASLETNPPFDLFEVTPGIYKTEQKEKITERKDQVLKGSVVSSGSVYGVVTHIHEYADLSKITKKSILVLESATPVFAPFYTLSGGIISEMGGHLSHGAIVAREYGIPMLTGVENVCVILKEGQTIFLDADNETIKVIEECKI